MSRAFVKEPDGDQVADDQPEIPISPHPNYVTPVGYAALESALQLARQEHSAARLDDSISGKNELARLAREIRYLEARLASARLVNPAEQPHDSVAFGAQVQFSDEQGKVIHYQIVGEDEADPATGKISYVSPLARAALGAELGDWISWQRPSGELELEIVAIEYPG